MELNQIREVQKKLDAALFEVIKANPGRKCAWYIGQPSVVDLARQEMSNHHAANLSAKRESNYDTEAYNLSRVFDRAASRLKARGLIWSTNQTWSAR